MRFIITSHPGPDSKEMDASQPPDIALLTAYMKYNEDLHTAGVLVASEGLNPEGKGARIEVLEIRQLTGEDDLPPEMLALIKAAAPTWSATFARKK